MSLHAYSLLERTRMNSPQPFVLERLAETPYARRHTFKVLDIPSGNGVIQIPLAAAGFQVTGGDLFPEYSRQSLDVFRQHGFVEAFRRSCKGFLNARMLDMLYGGRTPVVPERIHVVAADMEARLPFESGQFDAVLCVEGIEHVEQKFALLREFRRLLNPGAMLIITTPNLLCLRSRLAFAFAGQRTLRSHIDEFTEVQDRSADGSRIYHGHVFMAGYHAMRYALHNTGFRIRRVLPSSISPTSLALLPVFYPFLYGATRRSQNRAARKFARLVDSGQVPAGTTMPYAEILRHVTSFELLCGNTLALEAEAI